MSGTRTTPRSRKPAKSASRSGSAGSRAKSGAGSKSGALALPDAVRRVLPVAGLAVAAGAAGVAAFLLARRPRHGDAADRPASADAGADTAADAAAAADAGAGPAPAFVDAPALGPVAPATTRQPGLGSASGSGSGSGSGADRASAPAATDQAPAAEAATATAFDPDLPAPGHPVPDLERDGHPGFQDRAVPHFRPDMDASMTDQDRAALAPALGRPTLIRDA